VLLNLTAISMFIIIIDVVERLRPD
jgi:hypothetical protein